MKTLAQIRTKMFEEFMNEPKCEKMCEDCSEKFVPNLNHKSTGNPCYYSQGR